MARENTFNAAVVSGTQEYPRSTSWISMRFPTWTEPAHSSCGQSAQTHFTPKPTCTHGALVAGRSQDLYPGLGGRVKCPWHLTQGSVMLFSWREVCAAKCPHIYFLLFVRVCWRAIMLQKITVGEKTCITWDMMQKRVESVPWGNNFHQGPAPSRYC